MSLQVAKQQVAEVARRMAELDLVSGTSGNVSARLSDGLMAITPMGKSYDGMTADDIVVLDGDLNPVEGDLMPSSESLLHVAIYAARPDVGGIVHTHAVYSSAVAAAGLAIPPIVDEMVVNLGGAVRVSEYAPPASGTVAERVCYALANCHPLSVVPLPCRTKRWLPRPPYSRCEGLPDARKCARLIVTDSTLSRTRIWFPYPDFSFVVCT